MYPYTEQFLDAPLESTNKGKFMEMYKAAIVKM